MNEPQANTRRIGLAQLLRGLAEPAAGAALPADLPVEDLTLDSREVRPGSLFIALRGRQRHGLEFAAEAAARGARALLWEPAAGVAPPAAAAGVFAVPIPQLSERLGALADRFFGAPSAALRIHAVTGTNGKTTCAYLLAQSLERLARPAGYIGTIGWGRGGALRPLSHTTPDVISLQRMLAALRADGVGDVAMEVSSHALDQQRLAGVRLATAAFTNLTRDHLDYHGSMAAYGEAKARLFAYAGLEAFVINVDDPFGARLAARLRGDARLTAVWVGAGRDAWAGVRQLRAEHVVPRPRGLTLEVAGSSGPVSLETRLIGRFNAENSLIVLGCLLAAGVPAAPAAAALGACGAPPGRMEIISAAEPGRPTAVVDYAHTPDALAKALAALREHCRGVLWCVFGCGGDRDPGKRPLMGRVADELADRIIVTDDNPRSEDPAAITRAIAAAITRHPPRIIGDRAQAIAAALAEAGGPDVVLIAGKGHEDYQIYGAERRPFSDRREAERHLQAAA